MKFLKKHKAYITLVYAFLVFIHFVLKDRIYPFSILFYAFPLIILIILGLVIAFLSFNKKKAFLLLIGFQILLSCIWFNNYYSFAEKTPSQNPNHSILFWNVAKKKQLPIITIVKKVKSENIENIALVETENITETDIDLFKIHLKDYNFKVLKGNMFFGSKNEIKSVNYFSENKSFKANFIKIKNHSKSSKILITEIYASPFFNRETPLDSVYKIIKNNAIDVVVGDFNTPYNSVHFDSYKNNLKSFHQFSKGTTATWAYGFPLLELDHIWLNQKLTPIQLKKFQYKISDHQLLIAKYLEN